MKAKEIIRLANDLKRRFRTNHPYTIAEELDIKLLFRENACKGFKALTIQTANYPTIISINDIYSEKSKIVFCAHELGHALMHEGINTFEITANNVKTDVEYEANLFAVALLFDEREFDMPLCNMPNSVLKTILDYNIEK